MITNLTPSTIKKALKAYGVNALVRKCTASTISVWVKNPAEIEKAEYFFREFSIVRFDGVNPPSKPFHVNNGEFNSLVANI